MKLGSYLAEALKGRLVGKDQHRANITRSAAAAGREDLALVYVLNAEVLSNSPNISEDFAIYDVDTTEETVLNSIGEFYEGNGHDVRRTARSLSIHQEDRILIPAVTVIKDRRVLVSVTSIDTV